MRELKLVGLDADGKHIICEVTALLTGSSCRPTTDSGPRCVVTRQRRINRSSISKSSTDAEPKEIQAKIRAGASVEQVAAASGSDIARIRRFAHPVLLERYRAAELATAAAPSSRRRPRGADLCSEDCQHRLGLAWPRPRRAQLGRLAQRGRPLDGATCVEGRTLRQHRAFLLRPGRPRRNGHRARRRCQRAHRSDFERPLRPLAKVAHVEFDETARPADAARPEPPGIAVGASRSFRLGRMCSSECARPDSANAGVQPLCRLAATG